MHFHTIFYHYLYQDFYQPVWPNVAASITVGLYIIWRNRLHIEKLEKKVTHHMALQSSLLGRELGNIHAHLSHLHSSRRDSSGNGDNSSELFAREETEQSGPDPG